MIHSIRFSICCIVITGILNGCGEPAPVSKSFDLKQLSGRWESTTDRYHRFEEWSQEGENALRGKGFVLEGGDTTFIEFLRIREENGVLTYDARVGDKQDAESVSFRLASQTETELEFVNPKHDFPTRIVYQLVKPDSLHAFIEGPRGKGVSRVNFDFVRSGE